MNDEGRMTRDECPRTPEGGLAGKGGRRCEPHGQRMGTVGAVGAVGTMGAVGAVGGVGMMDFDKVW